MRGHEKSIALAVAICGALSGAVLTPSVSFAASTLSAVDKDKDGSIDLPEAKAAASALFDKLDTDKEGTLEPKELKGRLTKKELAAGDPDHDKSLSKDEYLAIVEKAFKKADHDGDGTVDAKELKTKAGRALQRLLH